MNNSNSNINININSSINDTANGSVHGAQGEELAEIAVEAYTYLFPLALMDVTRRVTTNVPAGAKPGFGPANLFTHLRSFPPGNFKEVVRPNFDTLYSILWFDLRAEPVVISAPDTQGRYYMLPMLDMWTDVFAVVGSRTTGTQAGHYALVGPGWSGDLPAGLERIEAPTPIGWIIGRTQTNGPADYASVNALQDGFLATPLSQWPGPAKTPAPALDPSVAMGTAPLDQVLAMAGADFFAYGAELMGTHPPHLVDQPILARMARLGVKPGQPFLAAELDADAAAAVAAAPAAALAHFREVEPRLNPVVNGWGMARSGIGVYGTNYLFRAVIAKIGLGANLPEDAIYPVAYRDGDGVIPNGSNNYVLHFDADALPPADAFWSLTMYDGEGFPVPNNLERYAIGDRSPLRYNDDGSLDLYIQHSDPGEDRRANWLPSPQGPIGVTMRLYGPRPAVLDGGWSPPPLVRA
ncbi:DUF1254 domain-containing protein [Cyanobium sp. NIES-981]|uniref:DUF1254 domain-containing protein n=1 Tax=Cyanobium sp. NIES-981 TaxID=1851505 RepID=UPI0007DCE366|nr:DUF1254 domain-containing protein [Cyanobium sp. NIES-981]SBO43922.1 conserved protein of unknown function [Cyanobium sp. NIES-981]